MTTAEKKAVTGKNMKIIKTAGEAYTGRTGKKSRTGKKPRTGFKHIQLADSNISGIFIKFANHPETYVVTV